MTIYICKIGIWDETDLRKANETQKIKMKMQILLGQMKLLFSEYQIIKRHSENEYLC